MTGRSFWVALLLLGFTIPALAQNKVPNPIFTADSMATGNYKDVLNSFFQFAFDRLTSPDKELKFTGTPFAVMAKLDTTLLVDTSYVKYRTLRNINYAFGLRLDSNLKFNGFTAGIKYAIINKRDETVSRAFLATVQNNERAKQLFALNDMIMAKISMMANPAPAMMEYTDFRKGVKNLSALSPALRDTILALATNSDATRTLGETLQRNNDFNLAQTADSIYQDLRNNFNKNLLWTVGFTDTTYKDQLVFNNIVLHSELVKGLNSYAQTKNDLELNVRAALQLTDDLLQAGSDLRRAVFSFEPGINLAIKTKQTRRSYLELKFSGTYFHNFSTLYAKEDRDRLFFNGNIRVRIYNDIWVPLEFHYDPKNGNLFGFINVRANFKALAGAAGSLFK